LNSSELLSLLGRDAFRFAQTRGSRWPVSYGRWPSFHDFIAARNSLIECQDITTSQLREIEKNIFLASLPVTFQYKDLCTEHLCSTDGPLTVDRHSLVAPIYIIQTDYNPSALACFHTTITTRCWTASSEYVHRLKNGKAFVEFPEPKKMQPSDPDNISTVGTSSIASIIGFITNIDDISRIISNNW
jgi:hypothetical protein